MGASAALPIFCPHQGPPSGTKEIAADGSFSISGGEENQMTRRIDRLASKAQRSAILISREPSLPQCVPRAEGLGLEFEVLSTCPLGLTLVMVTAGSTGWRKWARPRRYLFSARTKVAFLPNPPAQENRRRWLRLPSAQVKRIRLPEESIGSRKRGLNFP